MAVREWPLVAFTLLAQTAVGFFFFFVIPLTISRKKIDESDFRAYLLRALFFVFILLAVGAAISFFHLGNPFNAYRVLNNLRNSWLSREIFFELLMMLLLALSIMLEWKKIGAPALLSWLYGGTILSGWALVWSMANIYRLDAIPHWNQAMTPFSFFMTALILGASGSAALPVFKSLGPGSWTFPFTRVVYVFSLAFLAINFVAIILFDPSFGLLKAEAGRATDENPAMAKIMFALRLAFLAAAAVLMILSLAAGRLGIAKLISFFSAGLVFGLALISEILGRTLFYSLFKKAGL